MIQRRQDGSVNFIRKWKEYKNGFGKLTGEFWFGNENIHDLTKSSNAPKKSELLINMRMKGQSKMVYSKHATFEIGDEQSKYILKISGPSGNVSKVDNLMKNNGMKFSTVDNDNDVHSSKNCAATSKRAGGWWFRACSNANLNAPYKFSSSTYYGWHYVGPFKPEFVEMKVRRIQ